jgi:hypothetical protein
MLILMSVQVRAKSDRARAASLESQRLNNKKQKIRTEVLSFSIVILELSSGTAIIFCTVRRKAVRQWTSGRTKSLLSKIFIWAIQFSDPLPAPPNPLRRELETCQIISCSNHCFDLMDLFPSIN